MLMGARGRRGFTLIETVVTVGIVATLAAVVVPQVVKQFDAADPTKAAEDLNSIRTGIEVFGVNVRPQQPGDIEDLVNRVEDASAGELTVLGAQYSLTDEAAWNGPYLGLSIAAGTSLNVTVLTTGFGAQVQNGLGRYDVGITDPRGGDTVNVAGVAAADFVAVRIKSLSGAAFSSLNELIDGPNEGTIAVAGNVSNERTLGRLRCPYSSLLVPADGDACPDAYYLAVPIRQ
jgi:prepilin-type N-terminal cleavage/methylation domain-containing protein